jgi:hypothetical protein
VMVVESRAAAVVQCCGSSVSRGGRGVSRQGCGAVYFLNWVKPPGAGNGEGGYGALLNHGGVTVRGNGTLGIPS